MTTEELSKLTPQEKRVKIAEACGWKMFGTGEMLGKRALFGAWLAIPDYLNNLDAMHEAEKALTAIDDYADALRRVIVREHNMDEDDADCIRNADLLHATASQRADAFIEVTIQ